jgi:5-methylthioribose kinase
MQGLPLYYAQKIAQRKMLSARDWRDVLQTRGNNAPLDESLMKGDCMASSLDIERIEDLLAYLRLAGHITADDVSEVRILAGGVSNRTVYVRKKDGEAWVLKQALEKLRVKADWFSSPLRIHREALGLRWLHDLAPAGTITPLIFEDHQHHLLAMAAVPLPHDNWKTLLMDGQIDADHVRQFATLLGQMHARGHERREELKTAFEDVTFFETLRLEPYYAYAAQQVPAAKAFLDKLIADTRATKETLVHGDYSPKNILVHNGKLVLLDHEVIHFGDGAFDVGFSLTHLLSKARHFPARRKEFNDAAKLHWKTYRDTLGDVPWAAALESRAVRHTLACLLARAAGRSPLEYLNEEERAAQTKAVEAMLAAPPEKIDQMIDAFAERK